MRRDGYPFRFEPNACQSCSGKCCIGESGYIWIEPEEIYALADHLKMSVSDFMRRYVEKVGFRYSLTEIRISMDNYICVFFDMDKRGCSVYNHRPLQCKTFPFWPRFKRYPQEVKKECPGIELDSPNISLLDDS